MIFENAKVKKRTVEITTNTLIKNLKEVKNEKIISIFSLNSHYGFVTRCFLCFFHR